MVDPQGLTAEWVSKNPGAAASAVGSTLLDFTPIIGDAKGIYEAYQDPTWVNVGAAAIGLVPGLGDLAGKGLKAAGGLQDLAKFRGELGLAQSQGALARLDVGEQSFYGMSAHGQPITLNVNAVTRTHAEADVFQQAANAKVSGGSAYLYVDRPLCGYCGQSGGVSGMARQLGLNQVIVVTPKGTTVIRP